MSETGSVLAYVGLGSNLDQPLSHVTQALTELAELVDCRLIAHSSLYRSRPVGPTDQPDYINAVAMLETGLDAELLLDGLQAIEQRHGRIRSGERWGPRTLDLDLLLFAEEVIDSPRLQVPHPQMPRRAFVLYPLAEIARRNLRVPGLGSLDQLLEQVSGDAIERLD